MSTGRPLAERSTDVLGQESSRRQLSLRSREQTSADSTFGVWCSELGSEGGPAHCYRVGECWLVRLNIHGCVAPADQYLGGLRSVKTDPSVAILHSPFSVRWEMLPPRALAHLKSGWPPHTLQSQVWPAEVLNTLGRGSTDRQAIPWTLAGYWSSTKHKRNR